MPAKPRAATPAEIEASEAFWGSLPLAAEVLENIFADPAFYDRPREKTGA